MSAKPKRSKHRQEYLRRYMREVYRPAVKRRKAAAIGAYGEQTIP